MAARTLCRKEVTRTLPFPISEVDNMLIMVALNTDSEGGEGDTVSFLSVLLGFLDLAYEAGLHSSLLIV